MIDKLLLLLLILLSGLFVLYLNTFEGFKEYISNFLILLGFVGSCLGIYSFFKDKN